MRVYRRDWTTQELAELERLAEVEKLPASKIAPILKRSRPSITSAALRNNIKLYGRPGYPAGSRLKRMRKEQREAVKRMPADSMWSLEDDELRTAIAQRAAKAARKQRQANKKEQANEQR